MQTLIVGAGNLGTNVAYNLLRRGDSVIVTTRNEDKGKKLKEQLSPFGKVRCLISDPGTDFGATDMFRKAEETGGKIDNLIVTVGGFAVDSIKNPIHFGESIESAFITYRVFTRFMYSYRKALNNDTRDLNASMPGNEFNRLLAGALDKGAGHAFSFISIDPVTA